MHRLPPAGTDPVGYLRALDALLATGRYEALLATHEQAWLLAAGQRHLPHATGRLAVASAEAFARVQSKIAFASLCDQLAIPQPTWSEVREEEDLDRIEYPVWVKAAHSTAGRGVRRARTRAEAVSAWRGLAHAGAEGAGEAADYAWAFLDRYLEDVDLVVVSRPEYRPPYIEAERCAVLAPSIDADSPKNRVLDLDEAWSVARLSGIFAGEPPFEAVPFLRHDGRADAFRGLTDDPVLAGGPVPLGARVITQVNRWDRLKGGLELVEAFAENIAVLPEDAHLLLVGPSPDGPESQATLTQIVERCSVLPESVASRIHVAAVSMEDREVNATVVNAVQRVSSVVTQRSLIEAFGLTVAEAMWKKAPVVASAVGGIRDQIDDGVDGVLVDPADGLTWAEAVRDLLLFPERAQEMGLVAHESVRREFLSNRHLQDLLQILADLVG